MTRDRFHLLQKYLRFNGNADSSYDSNDGKRGRCQQICLFTETKRCCKLYYPGKPLSVGKLLVLFVEKECVIMTIRIVTCPQQKEWLFTY